MSRLDPHNQKLEVKSLDPGCSRLNPEASRLRINDVLKSLSVNHAHPISPQANTLTMLTSVFKNCDETLLMQSLIGSSFFWSRFFALVNKYAYSNSLLYSALSVMKTTEHMLMSAKKKKATDALKTFCSGFHGHFNILSIFAAELIGSAEASRLSVEIIYVVGTYISCLNKVANSSPEWAAPIVAEFYFSLRDTGFFSSLSYHMEENADSKIHDAVVNLFFTPLKTTLLFMATTKVSDDMIKLSKQFESAVDGAFGMNNSTKELFVKVNEEYEDPSRFSILQIVDVISILKDDNTSLKKMILEQLMFEKRPLPLLSGCMGITDMLFEHCKKGCNGIDTPLYIIQLVFNRDQITSKLVHKLARFWNESNSKGPEDLTSLLELLKNLLDKVDQNVSKCPQDNIVLERVIDLITTTPYEKLRQVQLQQQKGKQYQKWNQYAPHFNSMLSQQVEDYIRQQRLFQLQIGTWVYSDDPTVHHAKHPKLYYLVLSDNHNNLLAREFKYRIEKIPTVEQNRIITSDSNAVIGSTTTVIPLKRITDFHSRELKLHKVMPNHKKLVNVSRRTTYTEVQLIGKGQKCLLMFYLDNKETSYIWFDGLQLIASQKPKVSKTTKSQIDTLIDIRKNIQMVGLSDYRFVEGFEDYSDDDHYYDLDTLSTLTDDFYYD